MSRIRSPRELGKAAGWLQKRAGVWPGTSQQLGPYDFTPTLNYLRDASPKNKRRKLQARVQALLAEQYGHDPKTLDLTAVPGLDDLDLVEGLMALEEDTGIEIPDEIGTLPGSMQ